MTRPEKNLQKSYPVLGHSMRFALEPGDAALAEPCAPGALAAGDLALLVKWEAGRPAGYVIHRVLLNLNGRFVLTKGDANLLPDFPPSAFQPAARVRSLERGAVRWPAGYGAFWPLAAAYSLAANKALSVLGYAAYFFLCAAVFLLPRAFRSLLNGASLYWESRLHPALTRTAAALLRPGAAAGAGTAAAVKSGRITGDEVWSGRVTVADYLTIAPGASVRVEPGTEISFLRSEPWFFPVVRAAADGSLRELDSGFAKLLVYGEFRAAGSQAAPIRFCGPSFGGVHALGGGKVSLAYCSLEGAGACALSAWDHAFLRAENSVFLSCRRGLELSGEAAGALKDCSFSGQGGPAARVLDDATFLFSGGAADCGEGPAFETANRARAALCGVTVSGAGRALHLSGEAAALLEKFSASGCSAGALLAEGAAALHALNCDVAGGEFGVTASGAASLRLENCRFDRNKGHAVSLSGASVLRASGSVFSENGAGITARGTNVIELVRCRVSGSPGAALRLAGHNSLRLQDCLLEKCAFGIEGLGRNTVRAFTSVFRGNSGPGVRLELAAAAGFYDCVFEDLLLGALLLGCCRFRGRGLLFSGAAGAALRAEDCPDLLLESSALRGGLSGAEFTGNTAGELRGCRFEGQTGAAASSAGRARLRLEDCSVAGSGVGLKAAGASELYAEDCALDGVPGSAAEAEGRAEIDLRGCSVFGPGRAFTASGSSSLELRGIRAETSALPCATLGGRARLLAAESAFISAGDALYASGEAVARLRKCSLSSSGASALNLRGGRASLSGCVLRGRRGLQVSAGASMSVSDTSVSASESGIDSAGTFRALRLSLEGGVQGGMALAGPRNFLTDVSVLRTPSPGIALAPGSLLRARRVIFGGGDWLPPAAASFSKPPARRLFRFVAATAGLWPFSAAYRAVYGAAVGAAGVLLRGRGIRALYLYRGMAGRDWVAGLSDMDLACVLDVSSPGDDWSVYRALSKRLRALRALFPFTGEVLVADRAGFSAFMGAWGAKAAEFPGSSRLLAGIPENARSVPGQGGAADLTEAFYAYTLLMRHFFSGDTPEKFLRRNCLKNLVDILRYTSPAGSPHRLSRREYARGAGLPLDGYMGGDPGEYAFRAFTALHQAAPAFTGASEAGSGGADWFNRTAFDAAGRDLAARAGGPLSLVLDSLYRVYLLLPDEAAGDRNAYLRACAALNEARAASPALRASPLVLTRRAFALLCRLPYLNNPLFWADLAAPVTGAGPEDGGVFCYGQVLKPHPSEEELRAAAAAGSAHFAGSWRSLWGEMPPHYFYTRAAGLLLLAAGERASFSAPSGLRAALDRRGIPGPGWREFLAGGAGRENYEYISRLTAEAGRVADGR